MGDPKPLDAGERGFVAGYEAAIACAEEIQLHLPALVIGN